MSNHITIELCAEDRARIDRLTKAQEYNSKLIEAVLPHLTEGGAKPVTTLEAQEAPTESPAEPAAEPVATAEPDPVEEAKPAPTTQKLQQKVIALVNKGKKADVSAIVKSYAATVSGIPEEKRAECMERLNALEG